MSVKVGGNPRVPTLGQTENVGPTTGPAPATNAGKPANVDGFGGAPNATTPKSSSNDFLALVKSMQPKVIQPNGYTAHFGARSREAGAQVEGHGTIALPTGTGRGPSFIAEAGKPLTVSIDPNRILASNEKVDLVWRFAPTGEETVIPLSDGTRNADGRLNLKPATIDVPADKDGVMRLLIRTTHDGRTSDQWDPSNDVSVAAGKGATLVFGDDWSTKLGGQLRAGDKLEFAYDGDRVASMFGGQLPDTVTACLSFNGEGVHRFPLTLGRGENGQPTLLMPALRVPFEATKLTLFFEGEQNGNKQYDSAFGKNYSFDIGPTRDDADMSWKNEMLRSKSFPNLQAEDFVGIGPSSQRYNCIAWTIGVRDEWVWPGTRVEDFDALYAKSGFTPADGLDLSLDPNLEKVVIYALKPRVGTGPAEVTHGARQEPDGKWSSKIGTQPLIRHNSPEDLAGGSYGEPVRVYVRPRQTAEVNA